MREYIAPDFDITVYEIEDVITVSIGDGDPNPGGGGWYGG